MSFIILESNKEIRQRMAVALVNEINDRMRRAAPRIKERVKLLLKYSFKDTDEYFELLAGNLTFEFGFPKDSQRRLEAILHTIGESMKVYFYPFKWNGNDLVGRLEFNMLKEDFSDILGLTEAIVNTGKEKLPWLEWLLIRGDTIIISDYKIQFTSGGRGGGRSGGAIMVKTDDPSKGWRVPSKYSGTPGNNWLTRALLAHEEFLKEEMLKVFEEEITK